MIAANGSGPNRPMRISYLLSQFPVPTEVFAISDIAALRAQGHQVSVHTMKPPRRDDAVRRELCGVPADLALFRPTCSGALRWPLQLWRFRATALQLVGRVLKAGASSPRTALTALLSVPRAIEVVVEIERCKSDVVHLFWARHAALVLLAMQIRRMQALRSAFAGAYDLVADDFLVDIGLRSAEVVFSHAEANRGYVEAHARAGIPVHIIHRGIPLPAVAADDVRDPHRWTTASALVREKNVDAVIRLFAAAHQSDGRLQLNVYGNGPDRPRLEALARELGCSQAVTFGGHVQRAELFERMQKSGVFLLLSKKPSERLPNVIKEALWAGCTVVSSPSEGIEELIPDQSVGIVVDPDDTEASLRAIRGLMEEGEGEPRERRQRARALIQERFSSEGSMRRYVDAWLAGLAAKRPGTSGDPPQA